MDSNIEHNLRSYSSILWAPLKGMIFRPSLKPIGVNVRSIPLRLAGSRFLSFSAPALFDRRVRRLSNSPRCTQSVGGRFATDIGGSQIGSGALTRSRFSLIAVLFAVCVPNVSYHDVAR